MVDCLWFGHRRLSGYLFMPLATLINSVLQSGVDKVWWWYGWNWLLIISLIDYDQPYHFKWINWISYCFSSPCPKSVVPQPFRCIAFQGPDSGSRKPNWRRRMANGEEIGELLLFYQFPDGLMDWFIDANCKSLFITWMGVDFSILMEVAMTNLLFWGVCFDWFHGQFREVGLQAIVGFTMVSKQRWICWKVSKCVVYSTWLMGVDDKGKLTPS